MREKWKRHFKKLGFVVKRVTVRLPGALVGDDDVEMTVVENELGHYIGNYKDAYRLCVLRGIRPQLRTKHSKVCSIGYSKLANKWYGWSHRAISGFTIGSVVNKGDVTSEYLPVGFKADSMSDAKKMAVAFARSVS